MQQEEMVYPTHVMSVRPKKYGGGVVYTIYRTQLETSQFIIPEEQFLEVVRQHKELRRSEVNSNIEIARVVPADLEPRKLHA